MKTIEKGETFKLNKTENRMKAMETVLKKLQNNKSLDKGRIAQHLYRENVYSQRQDCKDFIKNIVRANNTEVVSVGKRKISLTGKSVVTVE